MAHGMVKWRNIFHRVIKILSPGMAYRVVWYELTDVWEEYAFSFVRAEY